MNCRRVEKLIPLYIEGDLASGAADRLTSHLEWCGRCNWLADEYKESQNWLRAGEQPEFDSAFLDNFKTGVLRRIQKSSTRSSLLGSPMQQWGSRRVLAVSAAALIIFGAAVFYVYQSRIHVNPAPLQAVGLGPNAETTRPDKPNASTDAPATAPDLSKRNNAKRQVRFKSPDGNHIAARQRSERPLLSPTNPIIESAAASAEPPTGSIADDPPGMLRIEMETGDPNIRIIWFAPKEVENLQTNP